MSVYIKRVSFWRAEMSNKPGNLARILAPLAKSKTDLEVLMGYRFPGNETRAAVELFPIETSGERAAAKKAGLAKAAIPAFVVTGKNKPGRVYAIVDLLSSAGINLAFVSAQAVGKKFSAVIGFEKEADAAKAEAILTGKDMKSKSGNKSQDKSKGKTKAPATKPATKPVPKPATKKK